MRIPKYRAFNTNEKYMYDVVMIEWSASSPDRLSRMALLSRDGLYTHRTVYGEETIHKNYELLQFVGWLDKNKREVYQDDLVQVDKYICRIVWDRSVDGWRMQLNNQFDLLANDMVIVGNVWEHPNILTLTQLDTLLTWPPNWNTYNALAPNPEAVAHAKQWITDLYQCVQEWQLEWLAPNVTADCEGEVVFEWRYRVGLIEHQLTIYIGAANGDITYLASNGRWEDDGTQSKASEYKGTWTWLVGAKKINATTQETTGEETVN